MIEKYIMNKMIQKSNVKPLYCRYMIGAIIGSFPDHFPIRCVRAARINTNYC